MKNNNIVKYRLDYLIYLLMIIILDGIALYSHNTYVAYIAIFGAWISLVIEAFKKIRKAQIGTEFFLVFATIVALMAQQKAAIMIVLLIMLIAKYIELLIEYRTDKALQSLMHLIPTKAIIVDGDHEREINLHEVHPGMKILIKTGGRIPVDGYVIDGHASINEAPLTGESIPKEKGVGSQVFASTFIESGSIIVKVEQVSKETLFAKIIALVKQAEEQKSRITIFTQKISFWFAPLILIFIVIVWIVTHDFNLVVTLLIFGSPLELSIITPLSVLAGTVAAFRHGIIVKSGQAFELFTHVDTMIFDKTGTLTLGEPSVVDIQSFDQAYATNDILKIAAIAERRSDHVVARAILSKAHESNIVVPQPTFYSSLVGHGVEIIYDNETYFFGNKHYVEASEHGNSKLPEGVAINDHSAFSTYYLASRGVILGSVSMRDTIRLDAKDMIEKLKKSGIRNILLVSGDRLDIAQNVANQLGIEKAYGEVFPDEKLAMIDTLQKESKIVAMVGDGINDVAALKQAHVGIAMGAMGMEPAIDAADIVLLTNNLEHIYFLRKLSHHVFRTIKQNLFFGFLILHVLGVILTFYRIIDPIHAAFFHAFTDLFMLINASRLISFKIRK